MIVPDSLLPVETKVIDGQETQVIVLGKEFEHLLQGPSAYVAGEPIMVTERNPRGIAAPWYIPVEEYRQWCEILDSDNDAMIHYVGNGIPLQYVRAQRLDSGESSIDRIDIKGLVAAYWYLGIEPSDCDVRAHVQGIEWLGNKSPGRSACIQLLVVAHLVSGSLEDYQASETEILFHSLPRCSDLMSTGVLPRRLHLTPAMFPNMSKEAGEAFAEASPHNHSIVEECGMVVRIAAQVLDRCRGVLSGIESGVVFDILSSSAGLRLANPNRDDLEPDEVILNLEFLGDIRSSSDMKILNLVSLAENPGRKLVLPMDQALLMLHEGSPMEWIESVSIAHRSGNAHLIPSS